jgi:hypothetical protein
MRYDGEGWFGALQELFYGPRFLTLVGTPSAAADPKRAFIGERAPLQYRSLAELYDPPGWSPSVCLSSVDPSADLSAMETTTPKDVNTTILLLLNTLIFATARGPSTRRTTIGASRNRGLVIVLGCYDS